MWPELNLLPHRAWARAAHRRRFVREAVWAALALLVAWGGAWAWLIQQHEALTQASQQARVSAQQSLAWQKQRKALALELKTMTAQEEAWRDLRRHQRRVNAMWHALAQSLPAGAFLTSLQWTPDVLSVAGDAATQADAQQFQQALSQHATHWRGFELLELKAVGAAVVDIGASWHFVLRARATGEKS